MCLFPKFINNTTVPCGHCIECLMGLSREWSFRCMLEASLYEKNCLLTLTFDEEFVGDNNLYKKELQDFVKRLRINIERKVDSSLKIRYFGCGEYGLQKGRKHYHIIIFNFYPQDAYFFRKDKKGNELYLSDFISSCWKKGFISVVNVNQNTCKYVTKYLQKTQSRKQIKKALSSNIPVKNNPFLLMSKGIGKGALNPKWLDSDKIYLNGSYIKIPRYFNELFKRMGFEDKVEANKVIRLANKERFEADKNNDFYKRRDKLMSALGDAYFDDNRYGIFDYIPTYEQNRIELDKNALKYQTLARLNERDKQILEDFKKFVDSKEFFTNSLDKV